MKKTLFIALVIWLGLSSSQMLLGADTCPQDSVIGRDQNNNCVSKQLYEYDEAGRTVRDEKWKLNDDSVLVGQSKTTTEYYSNGKTKEMASWTWSNEKMDWIGSNKYVYIYDENGIMTMQATYSWSLDYDDWAPKSKTEYEYNQNKKIILETAFVGQGKDWIPTTKHEYDYDAKNKQILDRSWTDYDATTETWVGSYWKVWAYESTTYPSQESLYEEYDWVDGAWHGKTKYDLEFNTKGRTILKRTYANYDPITQQWEYATEYHYNYDQWNNTVLIEQYAWSVDHWKGSAKEEYEYNASGKRLSVAKYAWDDTKRQWIGISKIKSLFDEAGNQILDEQYTWSVDDWAGVKKEEYIFNADKLILSTISYSWDVAKAQWGNNTQVLADYDIHKNQTKDERYQWTIDATLAEGGYWKGVKYETTTYNDKNVETDKITYQWDDTNRRWLGNSKSIYEFDAANHLILEEQYTWSLDPSIPEGGEWHGTKKEEFGYNAANQQTKAITYAWSDAINNWIGQTMKLSDFDAYKNQILNEQYTWVVEATSTGGYWQGKEKATYTFNKNKQQTSSWVFSWDDTNRLWCYTSRDTASFDAAKNQTLKEAYTYDVTNQAWVGTTKWEAAYDAAKNQTMDAQYEWDMTNQAWVGISKNEYGFNANKQQVMFATYKWQAGAWVGIQKEERELDNEGREILVASYQWSSNTWVGKSRVVTTYFKDKLIASLANYDWKSNKWVGRDSTLYSYNDANLETSKIVMLYPLSAWVNSTKLEQAYNESNTLYAKSNFIWLSNAWQPVDKWEAHFDGAGRMDVDSTMLYKNSTWIYQNRNTNHYDDQNRLTLIMTENWVDGEPSTGSKTENTYGDYGLTQTLTSELQGGTWIGLTQKDNTYNASGQLTQTLDQENTASGWQTTHLYQATYDGDKQTLSQDQLFTDGVAVSGTRIVYEYTPTENIETTSSWIEGGWVEQTRIGYYQSGNLSIETHYTHDGTQWIGNTKVETTTIGKNKEIATYQWLEGWYGISKVGNYYDEYEDETTASWNWKNSTWVCDVKKGESKYDNGKLKSQTTYKIVSNAFVFNSRVEYEYGTGDKDKTTATYTWNTTNQAWVGVSKSGVTYNGAKIASETSYTWISDFTWQPNQMKEYEYGDQAKDLTTAIYTWDATNQAWVGVSKSGVTYASNGKQASEFSYVWGDTCWLNVSKTEWEYGEGKNNSVATYTGVDTTWVGVSKVAYAFLENGDPLSVYTYKWDSTWVNSQKEEYTYDDHGNTTYHIYAQWLNNTWSNLATSTRWDIFYNEKDSIVEDAHYKWSTAKKDWIGNGSRYIYTYNEEGLLVYKERDVWSSNKWTGSSKRIWEYTQDGYISNSEVWSWNKTRKIWIGVSKSEYGYFHDSIQSMTADFCWSDDMMDWEGITKYETIYNDEGKPVASCRYTWSYDFWCWIGRTKTETKYNDKGQISEQLTSRYNTDWYYDTKSEYFYDTKHGQIEKKEYTFYEDSLVLTYHTAKTYDEDSNSKLRSDLDASWDTNGNVTSYSSTNYFYACDPKYIITAVPSIPEGGTVTGGGEFIMNAQTTLTATPSGDCYLFTGWSDGEQSATRTVIVTETKTYTANFSPREYKLQGKVSPAGGGQVSIQIKENNK